MEEKHTLYIKMNTICNFGFIFNYWSKLKVFTCSLKQTPVLRSIYQYCMQLKRGTWKYIYIIIGQLSMIDKHVSNNWLSITGRIGSWHANILNCCPRLLLYRKVIVEKWHISLHVYSIQFRSIMKKTGSLFESFSSALPVTNQR